MSYRMKLASLAKSLRLAALAFAAVFSAAAPVQATLMNTVSTNGTSQTFYTNFSNTDLIDVSQTGISLLSATHGAYTAFMGSSAARLNDGNLGATSNVATVAFSAVPPSASPLVPWTSTFTLDTSIFDQGYSITNINTFTGWAGGRSGQNYTVRYTTVSNPIPQVLGSFSAADPSTGSTRIEIFDSLAAPILVGVKSIIFDVTNANNVYREFDVIGFGVATPPVPEPSTLALLGIGVVGMAVRHRRRRMV